MTELNGKRVAFTGDLGFENQDILHRCWGDTDKARALVRMVRDRLLPRHPDVVFTGHGVRTDGTGFLAELIRHTDDSLARLGRKFHHLKNPPASVLAARPNSPRKAKGLATSASPPPKLIS